MYLLHERRLYSATRDSLTNLELDTNKHLVDLGLQTKGSR